jgi:hypothetical protein
MEVTKTWERRDAKGGKESEGRTLFVCRGGWGRDRKESMWVYRAEKSW